MCHIQSEYLSGSELNSLKDPYYVLAQSQALGSDEQAWSLPCPHRI